MRTARGRRLWVTSAACAALAAMMGCGRSAIEPVAPPGPLVASRGVFSPARSTLGEVTRDFFGVRPAAVQPIPFPHKTHIDKGIKCTEYCHESVTKGPVAGLPSVKTC